MPNNKYDYTVKIGADISNLKKDIKSELASVLREVDNVGDAVSKGITPNTKEFESKIASLESKMEKLAQNSKDVEQQVSSMKTAFKGFTELEASMKAIGEQNKEMYETFVKMTPYIHEFAKTFTAMKPEQAGAAFESVMKNASANGQAATQTFKDMQNAASQVGKTVKKSFYEVETAGTGIFDELNQEINTSANSLGEVNKIVNILYKSLHRLQSVNMGDKSIYNYGRETDINTNEGQEYLIKDIEDEYKRFISAREKMKGEIGLTEEYFLQEKKTIESLLKLYEMTDFLQKENYNKIGNYSQIEKEIGTIDNLIKQYEQDILEFQTKFAQKVELKPLKLKIDISDDGKLISQINEAIERIQNSAQIKPLEIPLNFIDVGEKEIQNTNNKKSKKKKNVKVNTENNTQKEVEVDSRLTSVVKEIQNLQDNFDKIKAPLLSDIKEWRHNLEEYLTLEFKWQKGDKQGIIDLFDDINDYAEQHPIWLNPDTDKLISEIETALIQHQFKLDLSGSGLKVSGNTSGAIPVAIVGGGNAYQSPTVQRTIKQSVSPTSTTTKTETKKDTSSVDQNSKVVQKNSDVINDVINEFKTYAQKGNEAIHRATKKIESLTKQNANLDKNKPKDAEKIVANESKIKREQAKISVQQDKFNVLSTRTGIDVQNISKMDDNALYDAIYNLVTTRNEIVDILSTAKIGTASNSRNLLTPKQIKTLVGSIKSAQEMLSIEMKEANTVSKELAAKDYLKDAEQLTRMGMALKTANREIRNNIVPTEDSLQQVVDVFGGRGLTSVTQSAQNLKDVLGQYHDVFDADGGYQEYVTRLNDEIIQLQAEIDKLSKHPRKNKSAIAEKKGQLGVKQFELEDIQNNVEPVLNVFKESIKGLPGQIAELLKGYKFIVEFVDANGKKVTESFNDASARAPQNTEPYYKRSTKMFDRINAGDITSITPKSTPNDAVFSILYGDKISKSTAIQQIIDSYNQLDKKAQLFIKSLIDIQKLTDENISLSEKWALVEDSEIIGRNNKGQVGRSVNVNKAIGIEDLVASKKKFRSNKSKIQSLDPEKDKDKIADLTEENKSLLKNIANIRTANKEIDSFIDTVVGAYFGVNSNAKLKAGQQKMLMRGSTISYGSSKDATVSHPEERKYQYTQANRTYRAPYDPLTAEEINAKLQKNKTALDETNANLGQYNQALQQAEQSLEAEKIKLDTSAERKELQKKYSNITDAQSFQSQYNTSEQEVKALRDAVETNKEKSQSVKNDVDKLYKDLKTNENAITSIQSRVQDVSAAGGVQSYLNQLNSGIEKYKILEKQLKASEGELHKYLIAVKSGLDRGKFTQEEYDIQKRETDKAIAENNEILKSEQEKYSKLAALRDSFMSEISKYDKDTGLFSQLTDDEYYKKKEKELEQLQTINGDIQKNISQSESKLSQVNSELASEQSQLEMVEANLEQMRIAFAEYYYQYVNKLLNDTNTEISRIETAQKNGTLKKTGLDENTANAKLLELKNQRSIYSQESDRFSSILKPDPQKIYQERIQAINEELKKLKDIPKNLQKISDLKEEKKKLNEILEVIRSIASLKAEIKKAEDEAKTLQETEQRLTKNLSGETPETPVEPGSKEAKTLARREIAAIDADLELADKKLKVAEQKKKDLDNRIKVVRKKGKNAQEVKQSEKDATGFAIQTAKKSSEYKDYQNELYKQFEDGVITWDEYSTKIQAKIDEIVAKLKEAEPEKYTGKSATEIESSLTIQKQAQQDAIKEIKQKTAELKAQRQEAIAFAKLSEEDLATQRAITEEKKEQVQATQQEKIVQEEQAVESRVQEQSNQVNNVRVQELDNKISAIDEEIAQLRAEIKSEPKKKKTTTPTKKLTDKQQTKVDKQFLGYAAQIKAKEINKNVNVKDIDLKEAIKMQKQLNALAEQGNQNTEEYLTLQRQLSELISKRTNQLKGTGRNTSTEKYDWIKNNVSKDVADFYSSDQYVAQAGKFDNAVASKLGTSLVEGFSNEFKTQCVEAAKQAYNNVKSQGGATKDAKKAAISVIQKLLDSVRQGVVEGVKKETVDSSSDISSKKARIKELTAQKKQYQAEKEQLVAATQSPATTTPLPVDEVALQAGTVILSGGDSSGPWALKTSLLKTNEILNSISGKIDSIKGGSGSSDDSSTYGGTKKPKKKEEIDVNAIRQRLESEAADNRKRFSIDGLEDSIKSVQKFDEKTLKLYETFTLANGEAVKFTYSLNAMDGTIKSSYTTIANFEGVAKKAYTELGKSQIATKQLFEGFNFPQDKITAYNNAISALDNKLKSLGENGITDPKDANEVEVLTGNVKKFRTEIENMVKASEKTTNNGTFVKKFNADEVDNVKASMKALAEEIPNASLATSNFNDKTNELTFTVKTGKNELTTLTYKFDELTQSVYETGRASRTTTGFFKGFFSDVGAKISELARYYTGMSLITESLQQVRRGVQYVREIDLQLTELKKVTEATEAQYKSFLQTMSQTASVVGSTVANLTASSADWARLNI